MTAKADFGTAIALSCVAAGGLAIGLSFPLLALNLDDWGVSEAGIGFFTLSAALSTLIATPFIPGLLGRFPIRWLLAGALVAIAVSFLGYMIFRTVPAWVACRFVTGAAFSLLFVACEAWALERAKPERRGFVMGAFASTFAGAMALGGAIVGLVGHAGSAGFLVGAGIAAAGLFMLFLPGEPPSAPEGEAARPAALLQRIRAAPLVMLAPLAMGAIETAKYNLVPIYARRIGLDDATAAAMITASGLGVLMLQPLLGWLADRIGVRPGLMLCAAAGVALPLAIAAVGAAPAPALALVFAYSGLVTGLYAIGLVWLARTFAGGDLAAGNAAYALCYGVGQVVGPAVAGTAFTGFGPWGFMAALAALSGLYIAAMVVGRTRPA